VSERRKEEEGKDGPPELGGWVGHFASNWEASRRRLRATVVRVEDKTWGRLLSTTDRDCDSDAWR